LLVYILYTIFFISCIVLVGAVLLQPGKTDAGALFTSNISNAAFGPRGTASVLSKITIVAAAVFFISALLISMPALTGQSSILTHTAPETQEAPANNAVNSEANTAPAQTDTNAASAQEPVANTEAANTAPANAPANK
jgi:preprotein translocase subunit SecG